MDTPRLAVRADAATIERLDRLAARLSRPGAELTRSHAARAALLRGLDAFEAESGAPTKKGTGRRAKPAKK